MSEIKLDFVLRKLLNFDTNKGDGPDGISPVVLKNCASALAAPLHFVFSLYLRQEVFPSRWKISSITPIHKNETRASVENYRGAPILHTIAKFFEYLVCVELTKHFKQFISSFQHGFFKGRSTRTNLTLVIDSGQQLDMIYTDFSKAFERVSLSHAALFYKLNKTKINSALFNWLKSYIPTSV